MQKIYGYSDDLIELEGDITKEIPHDTYRSCYLLFSTGTVLKTNFYNGYWRFTAIKEGRSEISYSYEKPNSEIVYLRSERIDWVIVCTNIIKADGFEGSPLDRFMSCVQ